MAIRSFGLGCAIMLYACGYGDESPVPDNAFVGPSGRGLGGRSISSTSGASTGAEGDVDGGLVLFPPLDPNAAGLDVPQPSTGPTGTGFAPGAGGFGNNGGNPIIGANNIGSDNAGTLLPQADAGAAGTGAGINTPGSGGGIVTGTGGEVSSTGGVSPAGSGLDTGSSGADAASTGSNGSLRCVMPAPPLGVVVRSVSGNCLGAAYLVEPAVLTTGFAEFAPAGTQSSDSCLVTATRVSNQGCALEQRVTCTSGRTQVSRCSIEVSGEVTCTTQLRGASGTCTVDAVFASVL